MENPLITITSINSKRNLFCKNYTYNYIFRSVRNCDPTGQLQVGNEPEIGNGRKMAGEMAGGHFSGKARNSRKNGRANGRTGRKWPNFRCPAIFSAIFRGRPEKWPPAISPAIFRPFPISGSFPTCSWPMGSQVRNLNCNHFEKVHVNTAFFWYFGILGGFSSLYDFRSPVCVFLVFFFFNVEMDAAVFRDRLPEVSQKPFLGPGRHLFAVPTLKEVESACIGCTPKGSYGNTAF